MHRDPRVGWRTTKSRLQSSPRINRSIRHDPQGTLLSLALTVFPSFLTVAFQNDAQMKSRAESLDTSLEALKTSFESINQLSTSLSTSSSRSTSTSSSTRPSHTPQASLTSLPSPSSTPTRSRPLRSTSNSSQPTFSPLLHLAPLLALPILLRVLDRKESDSLWGSWEPALRSWEDSGVEGAREIGSEAREVLRGMRRGSVSVRSIQGAGEGLGMSATGE